MTDKQKLNKFFKLQDKGILIDEIAIQLGLDVKSLRRFLNKNGYKSAKGKYVKKENVDSKQLELSLTSDSKPKKTKTSNTKPVKRNQTVTKKNPKVSVSAQDLDKLCEVYDWYLSVRDIKALKPKVKRNKKDILIESSNISDFKTTRIKIEKNTWEEFERLCSNSSYDKHEIITQAIKEFLKQYKDLI